MCVITHNSGYLLTAMPAKPAVDTRSVPDTDLSGFVSPKPLSSTPSSSEEDLKMDISIIRLTIEKTE